MKRNHFLEENAFVLKHVCWLNASFCRVALLVTHTTLRGCTAKPWAEQQLELPFKPMSTDPLEAWTLEE